MLIKILQPLRENVVEFIVLLLSAKLFSMHL